MSGDPYWANVALLLPMTGANGSTTFTDYSPNPKTVTANGDAQISTAQSKWGSGSGYFDGTGDYLSIPHDNGFDFGTEDFTIESWVRLANVSTYQFLIAPSSDSSGYLMVAFNYNNNAGYIGLGAAAVGWPATFGSHGMSNDTWHHQAIARDGASNRCFIDGVQIGSTVTDGTNWTQTGIRIGLHSGGNYGLSGYIQDLRITKGVARYTANFTPPSAPFDAFGAPLISTAIQRPLVQAFNPLIFHY